MSGTTRSSTDDGGEDLPPELEGSGNVLVLAPAISRETARACRRLRADEPGDHDLLLATFTRAGADDLDRWLEGTTPGRVLVVDAAPTEGSHRVGNRKGVTAETVSSPGNLTEIGVAVTKHLSAFEEREAPLTACVRSLTALLQYTDAEGAYRFLNVMTGRLAAVEARAHYHLDPSAHDEQTVRSLSSLFDAVVESGTGGLTVRR
ncbi:MAG: hypothetical protein ABEI39_03300 [Halobacteriales archaeon]